MQEITINMETPWILEGKYDPDKEFWSASKIINHVLIGLISASPEYSMHVSLPQNRKTEVAGRDYSAFFQKPISAWSEYQSLTHIIINEKRWAVGIGFGFSNFPKVGSNKIMDIAALPVKIGETGLDPHTRLHVDLLTNHDYCKSMLIALGDGGLGVSRHNPRAKAIGEFIESELDRFTVYNRKDNSKFFLAKKFDSVPEYRPELADKLSELIISALSL